MLVTVIAKRTPGGVEYDPLELDRVERRFWAEIWDSVPEPVAAEHGIGFRAFGVVQATTVTELPEVAVLNLVLGAAEAGGGAELARAVEWARSRGVRPVVPVTPDAAGTAEAEAWLREHGFEPGYAWMKFVRDPHPPRFPRPEVEVVELSGPDEAPFGAIAAAGFGMPAWAAELFAHLPGREGWRCYVARVDGEPQACGAMLIDDGVAERGIGATLEPARGRGCQLALLHRRIADAGAAGCRTLFVETGARVPDRPAASYRNILRAGFEEAYLRPNWSPGRIQDAPGG
jgi:GNAT superfamily N-acetyltransferase